VPVEEKGPRPSVYARLSAEAEVRLARRVSSRLTRWAGFAIIVAIVVVVALAVSRAPW
jgi:hypothetical protein